MMATILKLILFLFVFFMVLVVMGLIFLLLSDIVTASLGDDKGWHRCYRCKKCGAIYDPDDVPYICKYCGTEITRYHDMLSATYFCKTPDLNSNHDTTNDCEIVIARKVGRRWEIMKKESEK